MAAELELVPLSLAVPPARSGNCLSMGAHPSAHGLPIDVLAGQGRWCSHDDHSSSWLVLRGSYLFGGDQVGDLLRLVDLDKVSGVVEQM